MDRYSNSTDLSDNSPPSEAWLFAQAILGKPIPRVVPPEVKARTRRAELQRLAPLSERHAQELRKLQAAEAEARRDRERLEWAAGISTRAEEQLRALQRKEADEREACRRAEQFYKSYWAGLTEWNEADHPRASKGTPTGGQWVEKGGGGGGGGGKGSFLDKITQRNRAISELTGVVTPSMIRAGRLAADLESAARLPAEVARAAAAGLGTGGKAVGNGFATAVKDVATLGLSPGQLELIGVTKEDRERGYDTAVAISTASGQILIAVGTGGTASALSKGGSIARTASGALVAYDAAGNAVGVVQGAYDASQNGVNIANGAQVAGGLLGLSANAKSARDLGRAANARHLAEIDEFVKKSPRKATPTRTPADAYEIKHTGPYNYELSGGGVKFEIDGYRGSTILEAKHVDKPNSSPYVPGSTCPEAVRASILAETRDRLKKAATIIKSGSTPFKSVEIITNTPGSKSLFENMLREVGLPGTVRLAPKEILDTMTSILLLRLDEMPFDVAAVAHILSTHSGFRDVRFDEPGGAAVEADYREHEDWTTVRLSENPNRISLSGTSDATLRAALLLQSNLKVPLRIFDTNYSFDLVLEDYSTVDELRAAIESAQAN